MVNENILDRSDVEKWVWDNLVKDNYVVNKEDIKDLFYDSVDLFRMDIPNSFLLALINHTTNGASFKYEHLVGELLNSCGAPGAWWVYLTEPDNAIACVSRPIHSSEVSKVTLLEKFETHLAEQGGDSYLALLAPNSWMLWHEYSPANDFEMSFFGPKHNIDFLNLNT